MHVINSTTLSPLSRLGIEFVGYRDETAIVRELDAQKERGVAIYGSGYLISDRLAAEREKAEREKAEREKAEREKAERENVFVWKLSERELGIIASLSVERNDDKRKV